MIRRRSEIQTSFVFVNCGGAQTLYSSRWLNGSNWVNAVGGNIGGSGYARAVVKHDSDFAVTPEASTLVIGGLALVGFAYVELRHQRHHFV